MSTQSKLDDHTPEEPTGTPAHKIPLHETVYAELNKNKNTFPDNAWYIAVVREENRVYGMHKYTDRILSALAPPESLTTAFKNKQRNIDLRDVLSSPTEVHSQAWAAVQFESRYQEYLRCQITHLDQDCSCISATNNSSSANDHIRLILEMLEHRPVVLVGLTPSDQQAPRLVLQEFLQGQYEKQNSLSQNSR